MYVFLVVVGKLLGVVGVVVVVDLDVTKRENESFGVVFWNLALKLLFLFLYELNRLLEERLTCWGLTVKWVKPAPNSFESMSLNRICGLLVVGGKVKGRLVVVLLVVVVVGKVRLVVVVVGVVVLLVVVVVGKVRWVVGNVRGVVVVVVVVLVVVGVVGLGVGGGGGG